MESSGSKRRACERGLSWERAGHSPFPRGLCYLLKAKGPGLFPFFSKKEGREGSKKEGRKEGREGRRKEGREGGRKKKRQKEGKGRKKYLNLFGAGEACEGFSEQFHYVLVTGHSYVARKKVGVCLKESWKLGLRPGGVWQAGGERA